MKDLNNYIIEKILISKDTKFESFVFKPKSNWDGKRINNLTVYLPFDIIITNNDNKHITIYKITHEYDNEYDYDYWDIYDNDDNRIAGLTSTGVYKLFINNEQIKISLFKNIDNQVYITSDAKILKNKESNIQEKILISKDTIVDKNTDIESFGKGEYIQFNMYDYLYDIWTFTKHDLLAIEKHFIKDKKVYYIKDKDLPRGGKLVNMIRKQQKYYVYGCHKNQVHIIDFPDMKILIQIYDDNSGNININDVYIYQKHIRSKSISEKLLIHKDMEEQFDYNDIYGKGELKCFKDCNIYNINDNKDLVINDHKLQDDIDKHFNDNDKVWVVTEKYKFISHVGYPEKKLNDDFRQKINNIKKSIWQHVYLLNMQRGYYLKEVDNTLILCIKDFYKSKPGIRQQQYIIKL